MTSPRPFLPLALALSASFALTWAFVGDLQARESLAALVAGGVVAFFAASSTADWLLYRFGRRFREWRQAASITRASTLAVELRGLPGEVALGVLRLADPAEIDITPGSPPLYFVNVQGERVPLSFVADWIELAEGRNLAPVRRWNDSRRRDWAAALTAHLCALGWAVPANGNLPARLAGRELREVAAYFGLSA